MHAVIKKNKARFILLAIGICFFFFLFGFSNSNERLGDSTLDEIVSIQSFDSDNNSSSLEKLKDIFPENAPHRLKNLKASSKRKLSTSPSTNNIDIKIAQSIKKEIIPVPITNIDAIDSVEKEFTAKGNTQHTFSKSNISFLSKKKFDKIKMTKVIPSISILNRLNKPKSFQLFNHSKNKNNTRYYSLLSLSAATYIGGAVGLYSVWYSDYDSVKFHYFDDRGEWLDMDKVGHFFSAYYETKFAFQAAHWTGLNRKKSLLIGAISSTLIQGTLEVMDGLSSGWGFSKADIAMNTMGTSLFAVQELVWNEQRISMKYSVSRPNYSEKEWVEGFPKSSIKSRAKELYGTSLAELILKDYNGQTLWMSTNISSFIPESRIPKWLNIAVGYGVENVIGAYHNDWDYTNNKRFSGDKLIPRYRQFYLSLDLDLTKIKTKNPLLKTALYLLNAIKIPAPTLEYSQGQFKFIPMHF